tara:strand:- start:221 stop:373 length:153 start_codon:yes stop_codon:yes gene_type:complete
MGVLGGLLIGNLIFDVRYQLFEKEQELALSLAVHHHQASGAGGPSQVWLL